MRESSFLLTDASDHKTIVIRLKVQTHLRDWLLKIVFLIARKNRSMNKNGCDFLTMNRILKRTWTPKADVVVAKKKLKANNSTNVIFDLKATTSKVKIIVSVKKTYAFSNWDIAEIGSKCIKMVKWFRRRYFLFLKSSRSCYRLRMLQYHLFCVCIHIVSKQQLRLITSKKHWLAKPWPECDVLFSCGSFREHYLKKLFLSSI